MCDFVHEVHFSVLFLHFLELACLQAQLIWIVFDDLSLYAFKPPFVLYLINRTLLGYANDLEHHVILFGLGLRQLVPELFHGSILLFVIVVDELGVSRHHSDATRAVVPDGFLARAQHLHD